MARALEQSVQMSQQLAERIVATPQLTPKEKRLQSLYDTISAWMQDYTEEEFVDLSKCVWNKLYSIRQGRVAQHQRGSVSTNHPPTASQHHGYQGYYHSAGPPPPTMQATTEALQRQILSLQQQLQDRPRVHANPPRMSTPCREPLMNLSLGSATGLFTGLSPPRPQDTDQTLQTPHSHPGNHQYHDL